MNKAELLEIIAYAKSNLAISLDLSNREIIELPPEIGSISSLHEINLSSNFLTDLPKEFSKLHKLTKVNLSSNRLVDFPKELTLLTNLEWLNLSRNKIYSLPDSIKSFTNLENLYIANNRLTSLPPSIGDLTCLKFLDLFHNQLTTLPKEMTRLTRLMELYLRSNPLPIPPEILEKSREPSIIFEYYKSLKTGTYRPLHEAKIVLIGQGSVGKTSLVKRLIYNNFDINEPKTDGISIEKMLLKFDSQILTLRIWDFGGQDIMHATHQFFLTKRTLYILVLDSRIGQEENRVEYWLKIIKSYGGNSPVIIVGNKCDQQPLDIDQRGLQNKYPCIKHFVEISCLTGEGIEKLRETISLEIRDMPHIHDRLSTIWFKVKDQLESMKKDYITYNEYVALCKSEGIKDEISQKTLISFLHDLGVILNFREDPRLEDTNVLNPKWVTNGVYKILNSYTLFQSKGVLDYEQLESILDCNAYPKNQLEFIIDMMKKFELCFDFEGNSESKYLIPDLLPREEPFTGDWTDSLGFLYHYDILLNSIISRFIVRMHPLIYKNTIWRSGVVLQNGDNLALIKADFEDRVISIQVSGNKQTRHEFLSTIRTMFNAIHSTITGIQAQQKIRHPYMPDLILDFDEIIEFDRKDIVSFPRKVGNEIIEINVKDIINTIRKTPIDTPDVFISYSTSNKNFVNKIKKSLINDKFTVWQDIDSIKSGENWIDNIANGIITSKVFLLVLTPESVMSEWVKKEYAYAITARKKIIPIYYKKCAIPLPFIDIQYANFINSSFEIAMYSLKNIIKDELLRL